MTLEECFAVFAPSLGVPALDADAGVIVRRAFRARLLRLEDHAMTAAGFYAATEYNEKAGDA